MKCYRYHKNLAFHVGITMYVSRPKRLKTPLIRIQTNRKGTNPPFYYWEDMAR